jgi:deazaflavin-dependent oxidoreductase (nitroreductase family)
MVTGSSSGTTAAGYHAQAPPEEVMTETVRRSTGAELRRIKPFMKLMSVANTWVFRAWGGRLGAKFLRGAPAGLLTTTGRKSGAQRTTPLIYLTDGERTVLVASQGGMPRNPLWYDNLVAHPEVAFRTSRGQRRYRAHTVDCAEKAALWPRLVAIYRDYDGYQKRTDRDIPVVALEPAA